MRFIRPITGLVSAAGLLAGLTASVTGATPALAANGVPRPDHTVIVMMENHSFSDIIGNTNEAPYINSLASQGASFTNSHAIEHPSEPNYLDLFSGSNQGVTDDSCPHTFGTTNMGSQTLAAGLSFASYSEDLPSTGSSTCSSGNYARKHAPWTNFTNVPAADQKTFSAFPTDYTQLPTVSWVIPNLQDDMHDGTINQGDVWVQNNIDAYAQWAKAHNSVLILTWDEDDYSQSNQVPTIVVGQNVKPGTYSESINHYSVLRTVEDAYGLPYAGAAANATPITDIWSTGGTGGSSVSVSAPANQTTTVNTAASLQIQASDSAGKALTYQATGLPAGLSINAATGLVSGTATTAGTSTVTVTVTDSAGATGSTTFTWTVSSASGNNAGIWETYLAGNLAMDDPGSSTTAGTQLITWALSGSNNQRWTYYSNPDGTFTIKNLVSGLCIDDSGASTSAGSPIIQWSCTGGTNQEWSIVASGSGSALVNKLSGLAITTANTGSGSTLTQQPNTGTALQTWSFTKVG